MRTKPKRTTTRLWYVYGGSDGAVVSNRPLGLSRIEFRRIRACTAKAAGRRWIRNNLPTAVAGVDYETDNPHSPYGDITPDMVRRRRYLQTTAKVTVVMQD